MRKFLTISTIVLMSFSSFANSKFKKQENEKLKQDSFVKLEPMHKGWHEALLHLGACAQASQQILAAYTPIYGAAGAQIIAEHAFVGCMGGNVTNN